MKSPTPSSAILAGVAILLLGGSPALAGIRWIHDLEAGLTEARERQAPVFAFFWEYE